jgi:hypothetical protein
MLSRMCSYPRKDQIRNELIRDVQVEWKEAVKGDFKD